MFIVIGKRQSKHGRRRNHRNTIAKPLRSDRPGSVRQGGRSRRPTKLTRFPSADTVARAGPVPNRPPIRSDGMKFLFLGDIVGKPGMVAVQQNIGRIREELELDYVVANAENAADGSGLLPKQFEQLVDCGIDGVTLGDHIFRRKEIISTLQKSDRIVKPANYPETAAGRRWTMIRRSGRRPLGIVSIMGRVFMRPVDCPFTAVDEVLEELSGET